MNKKILLYLLVGILVIGIAITFVNVFSFEHDEEETLVDVYYPKIDDAFVDTLYSYIPEYDFFSRTTMYDFAYTKYQNLSYDVVLEIIYQYILQNDAFMLLSLSKDELDKVVSNKGVDLVPLYKITIEAYENAGKKVFGKEAKLPRSNFSLSDKIQAQYIDDFGYYIYEKKIEEKDLDFLVERVFKQYVVTNNNNTILVYDYYVKCNDFDSNCYNDEKRKTLNSTIQNNHGGIYLKNRLQNAQVYMHTFKFEDGYYYWYSSELVTK